MNEAEVKLPVHRTVFPARKEASMIARLECLRYRIIPDPNPLPSEGEGDQCK